MKIINVPSDLILPPFNNKALKLGPLSLVDSCFYNEKTVGRMFLEEHIIIYVLNGQLTLTHQSCKWIVKKDEFVLLQRAQVYDFVKEGIAGGTESAFHGMLFCLKDDILLKFIRDFNLSRDPMVSPHPLIRQSDKGMRIFIDSMMVYFDKGTDVNAGLLKCKIMELLYSIASSDTEMQRQIMALGCPVRKELAEVLDEYYLIRVSIPDLAYLCGRSLSNFKREFKAQFGISPALYIRTKRLEYATKLLESTDLSVADVCYKAAFENPTHFATLMKSYSGKTPSEIRAELKRKIK